MTDSPSVSPAQALDQLEQRLAAADAEVSAICHGKTWRMRVPAYPDDSDLVITEGLNVGRELLERLRAPSRATPEEEQ